MGFIKQNKIYFFILFLIGFSAFLRFHNLHNIYVFGFDEEYQATYAWTLVKDFHPIWIGVSASFLDFYLGPYFTYFSAFLLWMSRGDPLFTAYFAGIIGVATTVLVFFVGWKFFNLITGIIASLLYAGLPLIVFYDQKYWNPMFVQLIVLTMLSTLILVKKSPWWWLLYTVAAGVIIETDLAPLPLVFIGLFYFLKGKYWKNKKLLASCIAVFIFFYWPLAVFDYFHNWSNLTVLSRYSTLVKQSGASFNPGDKVSSFLDTMGRFWYMQPGRSNADEINISCYSLSARPEHKFIDKYSERTFPALLLSIISVVALLLFLLLSIRKKIYNYILLSMLLLASLFFYIIYTGGPFEYYLHGFITLFVFVPGILISHLKIKQRRILIFLLVGVLFLGINTILQASDKFGIGPKKRLVEKVMNMVGDTKFSIDGMGICHNYEGWRYLFKAYGKTPTKSYTDESFAWLYKDELDNSSIKYEVILSESRLPLNKKLDNYIKINEGGYSAYIKEVK